MACWITPLMFTPEEAYAQRIELAPGATPQQQAALLQALCSMHAEDNGPDGLWVVRVEADLTSAWLFQLARTFPAHLRERLVVEFGLGQIGDSFSGIRKLSAQLRRAGLSTALRVELADLELLHGCVSAFSPDNLIITEEAAAAIVRKRDATTMEHLRREASTNGSLLVSLGGTGKRDRAWLAGEGVQVLGAQRVRWSAPGRHARAVTTSGATALTGLGLRAARSRAAYALA